MIVLETDIQLADQVVSITNTVVSIVWVWLSRCNTMASKICVDA